MRKRCGFGDIGCILSEFSLQVVEDFASENCCYLELRTTPRATEFMSSSEYAAFHVSPGTHTCAQICGCSVSRDKCRRISMPIHCRSCPVEYQPYHDRVRAKLSTFLCFESSCWRITRNTSSSSSLFSSEADNVVSLAVAYRHQGVVGIDLGGNPRVCYSHGESIGLTHCVGRCD